MTVLDLHKRTEPTRAVLELAQAMQAGLVLRRAERAGDARPANACQTYPHRRTSGRNLAAALQHAWAPTAKRRPFGRVIRFLRGGLKGFMRPWLDLQTQFNHATIAALEASNQASYGQLKHSAAGSTNSQAQQAVFVRLNECFRGLQVERELLDEMGGACGLREAGRGSRPAR